jgi:hypothetical protein
MAEPKVHGIAHLGGGYCIGVVTYERCGIPRFHADGPEEGCQARPGHKGAHTWEDETLGEYVERKLGSFNT